MKSYIKPRKKKFKEAINPMESVVNLIDIMLIFACGLMISIASLWNLDLNLVNEINKADSSSYQDMGRVYKDPETGKMYVIKPADDSADHSKDGTTTKAKTTGAAVR